VAVLLKKVTGKPVILWVHRMPEGRGIAGRLTSFVLNNCDFVMFNSSFTLNRAKKISRMKAFEILPPGVDENGFRPMKGAGIKKRLGIPRETKMVFAVGRLVEKKGFEFLIRAMALLENRNAVCAIGGTGPLEQELKLLAKSLGLEKRVLFPGWIRNSELPLWMNDSDVVAVPSIVDSCGDTETLGIVAIEAIACGRPTIVSGVGGLVDVVKDGYNGFVVPQKDSARLAEKIGAVLSNRGANSEMGRNARRHAVENFSWSKTVGRTIEIYERLLAEKAKKNC
jgi:phosphatidylinositol alpha-1,6-mannosyltransferase